MNFNLEDYINKGKQKKGKQNNQSNNSNGGGNKKETEEMRSYKEQIKVPLRQLLLKSYEAAEVEILIQRLIKRMEENAQEFVGVLETPYKFYQEVEKIRRLKNYWKINDVIIFIIISQNNNKKIKIEIKKEIKYLKAKY